VRTKRNDALPERKPLGIGTDPVAQAGKACQPLDSWQRQLVAGWQTLRRQDLPVVLEQRLPCFAPILSFAHGLTFTDFVFLEVEPVMCADCLQRV
jgi:hypothetical protein